MTVNKLIKELQRLSKDHGRSTVVIDFGELKANSTLTRDYSHYAISVVKPDTILWEKDDSFTLADGSERQKKIVSLSI